MSEEDLRYIGCNHNIYSVTKQINVIFSMQVKGFEPAEREDHAQCAAQSSATLYGRMMHTSLALYSVQKFWKVFRKKSLKCKTF